jgi:hypothetical protein
MTTSALTRSASRIAALGGLLLLLFAAPALGQDAPLRKSDIVRMLSGSTYSVGEVATIVRSNCLSFTPTDRDMADFRDLGATDAVLEAVRGCASRRAAEGAGANDQRPVVLPTYQVEPVSTLITAPVDSVALVTVLVRRGGQPADGLQITLRGSGDIEGGATADRVATSGADGRATVRVPTGTRVARYPLEIAATRGILTGTTNLTLETTPGPPAVLSSPTSPLTYRGGDLELPIRVLDPLGNVVPDAEIAVAGMPDGSVLNRGSTGADGQLAMTLAAEDMRDVNRLVISSEGGTLAEIELRFDIRAATMQFIAGTSQTGVPEERFENPVTVEVYDVAGQPAANVEVQFTVRNGRLDAETLRTGADGRASVRVTAGSDASRPVEIRARSGPAEVVASLPVLSREGIAAEIMAQAQRRLAAGDTTAAVNTYRRATELNPQSAPAWIGMAELLMATGRTEDARFAYEQALEADPDNQVAKAALSSPALSRSVFGADVWGGTTQDNGRDPGIRYAEVRIDPAFGWLRVRGYFDDALNLRQPWLKRGQDDVRGFGGGIDLRWGESRRLTTTVELGRREQPVSELTENTFLLAQGFRLAGGGGVQVGGWVGRWFDRDDYVVFGEGRFPVSRTVTVLPSVSYGDNAGSNITTGEERLGTGRSPETEVRGGLKLRVESPAGWGFEPGLAIGSVSSDLSDEFSGSLLDATTQIWADLGQVHLQGFVRYQSPPGTPSFWTFALGFGFDVRARR